MRKSLLLILVFFLAFSMRMSATHIVGGEFELVHIDGEAYRLNLILYFDAIGGAPGAEDAQLTPHIYRKSDDQFMAAVNLVNTGFTFVPYSQPDCAIGSLSTRRIVYTGTLSLPAAIYDHPEGYYIAWERCCRNYSIVNIISQDPNAGGNGAGQTFYLEFPPVVKDGKRFINSSPILFPPLRDYACVDKFFYTPFGGQDPDGDSLVYSMVDPLDSSSDQALPPITTAPYPIVNWLPGFGDTNAVPGSPPLRISTDGLLTVQPIRSGLFVFAIKIEEFRDGEKIGEVRRDFQMLSVTGCDFSIAPRVFAETSEGAVIDDATDTLRFTFEDNKCFNLVVTDEDPDEKITFEAIPVNFEGVLADIFQSGNGVVNGLNDTLRIEVCLPDCPPRKDGLMVVDLLAKDDACAVPLIDTTRLVIVIEPPPNAAPVIEPKDVVHIIDTESELYELVINATDLDDDDLIIDIIPDGFDLAEFGMSLDELSNQPGALSSLFTWNANCKKFNLEEKNEFDLLIVVDDVDECGFSEPDTLQMRLVFDLPPNTSPEVSIEGLPDNKISVDVGTPIDLNLVGFDADGDSIFLALVQDDTLAIPGVNFSSIAGIGNVSSKFSWSPTCEDLEVANGGQFDFKFLVADDQCFEQAIDTVTLTVEINNNAFDFEDFTPPNAFSPYNGDDKSEFWEIANVPEGNCDNQYLGIGIYNRWGKELFASDQLNFRWDGGGAPAGVYYYTIKYTNSEFKGIIYLFDADPGNF